MNHWWLLFVLNVPLLQEAVRKYLIYSDLVFLGGDVLVLATAIAVGLRGRLNVRNIPMAFVVLSAVFLFVTASHYTISGNHIGVYGVGLRATFLPLVYMLVSARYLSAVDSGYERIFSCVNVWIMIIGIMAIMQIVLGKNHPINAVWGTSALGVGDFATTDKGVLIPGMFRPTSIFTHTGKFGQVIFTLVLFKWCYLLFAAIKRSPWPYALMLFDLAIILISGQRAALMFLVLSIGIVALGTRRHGIGVWKILVLGLLIIGGVSGAWVAKPDMAMAVYERFASVINAIPLRLEGNLWLPIQTVMEDHLMSGEGLGYFTFGARSFGGTLVYEGIKLEGLGESSLIRLSGEVGLLVAMTIILAYLTVVARAWHFYREHRGSPVASGALFFSIWVMCLMLWSNTADVFANSIVTTLGFALGGATLCSLQSMHGGEVASESVSSDRLTEGSQSQGLNSRNKLWLLQE
ncbi:membrane hypothetical protein [Candidatus Nitrospira nitrosa]|uniref:O-antigen polymerase n=1 Tax=Candidatus Nitrospira nitrosa TaxID=1742972 RepID=A0A0S4LJ27_9BACT|nr:hypothetical protein [Candidatus Nitrospira nitrosa]CUS37607.1 membrane hypothetical protein [Candidatus Nitrospira nitrosa]